jgi:hypothetical protein
MGPGTNFIGLMGPNLIPNILAALLFLTTLLISIRAFYLFGLARTPRLFVLALSMGLISLTAADNIFANLVKLTINTYWFLYVGQIVGYFFIWLSLMRNSESYLQSVVRWQVVVSVLVLGLLVLSPLLPAFPNDIVRSGLSGTRALMSLGVFFCYIAAFTEKETRFSLLMSIAFLLITFGQLLGALKYFVPNPDVLDGPGDIMRILGLFSLLAAVLEG